MRELQRGLSHWQSRHPEWEEAEHWGPDVSSTSAAASTHHRLRAGVTRDEVVAGLRPLLDLPVELVLPAHGAPTDRAALERALA